MDWGKIEETAKAGIVIAVLTYVAAYVARRALKP